jgi:hypothetical protein
MNIVRGIKSRRMRWVGHVAHMGERTGVYGVLVGKPGGRDQVEDSDVHGRTNTKMDPEEVGWGDMDWFELAQDRDRWRAFLNSVMYLQVP